MIVGLVAAELGAGAGAGLVTAGVVTLGDLWKVSIDTNQKVRWQLLRRAGAGFSCPDSDADTDGDSYGDR